ncbi:hypothetical protein Plec18167_004229 [Paecilomyces lecythidis]|uniref:Uncharacterized protein n=1 Tax=Paecilomyces lecythidis TaxID=3004212 RepID=A0ABR3XSG4_9EURO
MDDKFVLVPVQVDAFCFTDATYLKLFNILHPPDPNDQAQLTIPAPITPPNYRGLRLDSGLIKHDIFEEINPRVVDLNWLYGAPRYTSCYSLANDLFKSDREGIYLHWSLPKVYRAGIAATSSAQDDHQNQKLRQGFPGQSESSEIATFRPVPDRWIVVRHTFADGGRYRRSRPGPYGNRDYEDNVPGSERVKVFVVESNLVRSIDQIPPTDDLLATTSPYVDPSIPLEQQGEMFLGRTVALHDWDGDVKTDPLATGYIPLTVMRTANPYFADYQQHNSSVFSFFDDLVVKPGDVDYEENAIKQLMRGNVSYTILGYHSTSTRDPLVIDPKTPSPIPTHEERLKTCFMEMKDTTTGLSDSDRTWLAASVGPQMRTLCHGNAISINVDKIYKDQLPSPGNDAQRALRSSNPIAVGTNPIDALLGWMRANMGSAIPVSPANKIQLEPEDISFIEQQLLKIQTLVQSVDDDVDSQLEAADLIATNNFARRAGGATWHLKKNTDNTSHTSDDVETLRSMNRLQDLMNAYLRESAQLKRNLFEEWWKYVVDRDRGSDEEKNKRRQTATLSVAAILQRLQKLGEVGKTGSLIDQNYNTIQTLCDSIRCKAGVRPSFFSQKDPTLLFAGIPSGRDTKLTGKPLPVRTSGQEDIGQEDPTKYPDLTSWFQDIESIGKDLHGKIPPELEKPVVSLFRESPWLSKRKHGSVPPYGFLNDGVWDGNQAWFPLFFEWTVEYYHIPKDQWDFIPQGPEAKLQYGIKAGAQLSGLPDIQEDFRIVSGRSPVLPQVSSSLQTSLKQIFAKMNPDELNSILSQDQRDTLFESVKSLQYFSASMDGFTDQLLTRVQGTHVQPNSLSVGGTPEPLAKALELGSEIGLDRDSMSLMDFGSPHTPFANLIGVPADPSKFSPFKPCTHGQFRFTKLVVVDKFGQVVTPVDLFNEAESTPIFPCLGQTYSLEPLPDGTANAVLHRTDQMSQFVQLPPSINQPARVNAEFVSFSTQQGWRPVDEWENPVRGWIVMNFPDFSIQVFDAEGHFIREFQVMGTSSTAHPFKPVDLQPDANPLLSSLMKKLQDPGFLQGLFMTLSEAVETVTHPPTAYAESVVSILGKPLALVEMGFSLELADAPLVNQSTISPNQGIPSESVTDYEFSMKLGDMDNVFDGLSGYFELQSQHDSNASSPTFNLDSFFSYFTSTPASPRDPSKPIPQPLQVRPYYISPKDYNDDPTAYAAAHNSKRHVIAALIDPFVPVHAYTQILPLKTLSLPPWVISSGIARVSAFFRMGPLLIPGDVPPFCSRKKVDHDYRLDENNKPTTTGSIAVPTFSMSDWVWLQPFFQDRMTDTEYNFVDLESLPLAPRWEPMPYTAVEGFLQMKKPFAAGKDDVPVVDH